LLGTFVELLSDREDAIEAAFLAIARVHRLMSAHEPDSDVSRINRFAHCKSVEIDGWTARVLERALFWSKESESAFDIVRAGKAALDREWLPRHADQPRPEVAHWTWLRLVGTAVHLPKPACLDLGGIAKGFAADRAIEAMKAAGATRGLVNAGGDIASFGEQPWTVEIPHPATRRPAIALPLLNQALATSAFQPSGGGELSDRHLVGCDGSWISASVRAPTAMDADALAKILLADSSRAARCLAIARANGLRIRRDGRIETVEAVEAQPVPA
jgi:thiamine biosynthesis lipoprotein